MKDNGPQNPNLDEDNGHQNPNLDEDGGNDNGQGGGDEDAC
jgi:hypothetical protein